MGLKKFTKRVLSTAALFFGLAGASEASAIGNWDGSNRSWNNLSFSAINALMTSNGNTVLPDASLESSTIGSDLLVIGEPGRTPTSAELNTLRNYVTSGHSVLVMMDSGFSANGGPAANTILAGLGTTMLFSSATPINAPLTGGNTATQGPPFNLVGLNLSTSAGSAVSGGTALAGSYINFQQIGNGKVYAFADRSDSDVFIENNTNGVNARLFVNIVANSNKPNPTNDTPEPGNFGKTAASLAALALVGAGTRKSLIKLNSETTTVGNGQQKETAHVL